MAKKYHLKTLFRRFVFGGFLTFLGSWLLAAFKLTVVQRFLDLPNSPSLSFILDLSALTLAIFGLLTVLIVLPELRTRIDRVDSLGEKKLVKGSQPFSIRLRGDFHNQRPIKYFAP